MEVYTFDVPDVQEDKRIGKVVQDIENTLVVLSYRPG